MAQQEWNFGLATKAKENYTRKGRKNKSKHMDFVNICKMKQMELKQYLIEELDKYYTDIISCDGFVYARGKQNVLLTAHMDTVHKEQVREFYEFYEKNRTIISSPQGIGGDDRCGIYMILHILRTTELRPYILFCEDEEIGGVGSRKFCQTAYIKELEKMNMLIELDRMSADDLVYYDDINVEFHNWCHKVTLYEENWGSFSDISHLSPSCKVAGVNISCGYYNAHTTDEYVVFEEMLRSINKTIDLINASDKQFEYIEDNKYIYGDTSSYYGSGLYSDTYSKYFSHDYGTVRFSFVLDDNQTEIITEGESFYTCVAKLLMNNPDLTWNQIYDYYDISY